MNDENPNLPEWIAYHYQTLPLRSLIVAVDPASRSSPIDILSRWNNSRLLLDVQLWNDDDYLYETTTTTTRQLDDGTEVTKMKKRIYVSRDIEGHRTRGQNNFIVKCMAEFKRRNKTWVLLIDVDEYITFNRITENKEDEPNYPLEEAPEGIPTLMNWWVEDNTITGWIVNDNNQTTTISSSSSNLDETMRKSQEFTTGPLISQKRQIQPGGIVTDTTGKQYFLRNDLIIRDLTALDYTPTSMPIIKYFIVNGNDETCGEIYNDIYYGMDNGTWDCIDIDWEEEGDRSGMYDVHGGLVVQDRKDRKYFLEKEQALWPKRLSLKEAWEARQRLPKVNERMTILDFLQKEMKMRNGNVESLGPCITMPRLRYGSFESSQPDDTDYLLVPSGFSKQDFVTLRYRWHEIKGNYAFGKTMIDISRIPMEKLEEQAEATNVHSPLTHYCPRQVQWYSPQYVTSLFKVNHYLGSFEAYTYRNDVRVALRKSMVRYNELASHAHHSMDSSSEGLLQWLQEFIQDVGRTNAEKLLAGAGKFPHLKSVAVADRLGDLAEWVFPSFVGWLSKNHIISNDDEDDDDDSI